MSRRDATVRRLAMFAISLLPLSLAFVFLFNAVATPSQVAAEGEAESLRQGETINSDLQVVRVTIQDRAQLEMLAEWADLSQVADTPNVYSFVATESDLTWLDLNGYQYEIDAKATGVIQAPRSPNPDGGGIPGYACYRTVEETYTTATDIVAAYPTLAEWIDIGDSWKKTQDPNQGYDLRVLKLTNQNIGGEKPVFYATSAIHAREYATAELMTRIAERLVNGYGTDPEATWLLDHHEIHLVLQANPDGRKEAEAGVLWRKNANNNFCGGGPWPGIDLNRNFDFLWGCCGGSSPDPCSQTFRGPSAASEPETQAYQNYGQSILIDQRADPITEPAPVDATGVYIDVHSSGKLVLWSWGFTPDPAPNVDGLETFGRHMAYFNDHFPEQSIGLYPTDGTTKDYFYGTFGVAAYTFELGTQFFESCDYFVETLLPDNTQALLYAMKAARAPYLLSHGPDATDVALDNSSVTVGEVVTLSATIDDTRFNTQNGAEPTQPIVAAEYYVDTPPWDGGTPVAMSPEDGTFDSDVEDVTGTLDTSGLSGGQHIVYVRGQDADGYWGVVSAIFLYVLDPSTAGTVQGYVRESGTNAPLAATVQAGAGFVTQTDPATGFYSLLVPPGVYDVTASAPDHAPKTVENVIASSGQTEEIDFLLDAVCAIIEDDVENGNIGWTAEDTWAITDQNSNSPTHSWTDSPGGNYDPNTDASLISPVLDLTSSYDVKLQFAQACNTENNYDFCIVEASTDGGNNWSELARYSGNGPAWEQIELDASTLDNQTNARIRFRLTSDGSVNRDGWYLDDIAVQGAGSCGPPTSVQVSTLDSAPSTPGGGVWIALLLTGIVGVAGLSWRAARRQ